MNQYEEIRFYQNDWEHGIMEARLKGINPFPSNKTTHYRDGRRISEEEAEGKESKT